MKINKKLFVSLAAHIFWTGFAHAVERSGPNPSNLSPVGTANASLFTGAFGYTYPIDVPPGRVEALQRQLDKRSK